MTVSRAEKDRRRSVVARSGRIAAPAASIHEQINWRGFIEGMVGAAKLQYEREARVQEWFEERQVQWEAVWRGAVEAMTTRSDDEIR